MPPFTVLQVCMGNICRSPMAERLLVLAAREIAGDRADELLYVHGAGTGGWHHGEAMDPAAARQIRMRGADIGEFSARKLLAEHIDSSDLILTATAEQMDFAVSLRPDAGDRTFVLGEFARLLPLVDLGKLPSIRPAGSTGPGGSAADAVYARGVALVAAVAAVRAGRPSLRADDLADPWGRGDGYFARVADEIEHAVRPLAAALLG